MQNLKSEISKSQIGPVQFAISDFGFEISLRPISKSRVIAPCEQGNASVPYFSSS